MDYTQHVSQLVLCYEKSIALKILGFEHPAQFFWAKVTEGAKVKTLLLCRTIFKDLVATESIPVELGESECFAYTAEELSNHLPKKFRHGNGQHFLYMEKNEWPYIENAFICYYQTRKNKILLKVEGPTLTECLANMCIQYQLYILKR